MAANSVQPMTVERLDAILSRFTGLRILVVGDFFLDQYLIIEHALAEVSLETALEAHQVVEVRNSPGAAGTVTSNLRAMDIAVTALGIAGDDGHGYELLRALRETGVDTSAVITRGDLATPSYTKPMLRETDGSCHELNRLDIKNRKPTPAEVEDEIIGRLRRLAPQVNAVIVADQAAEKDCGAITGRVREEIAALAAANPAVTFAADSRERIGLYRNVIIKPNEREATRAVYPGSDAGFDEAGLLGCARRLFVRTARPIFLTMGSRGILVVREDGAFHVPACSVDGPVDIVGAGDATMAGLTAALAAGADELEAAQVGALSSAVTIKQIGCTGTASRSQIAAMFAGQPGR